MQDLIKALLRHGCSISIYNEFSEPMVIDSTVYSAIMTTIRMVKGKPHADAIIKKNDVYGHFTIKNGQMINHGNCVDPLIDNLLEDHLINNPI